MLDVLVTLCFVYVQIVKKGISPSKNTLENDL